MNITEAARATGTTTRMIRHYELSGLLGALPRTSNGYRQFGAEELATLHFIRQARRVGFPLDEIGELLTLRRDPRRSSRTVRALAERHLAALDAQRDAIDVMTRTLAQMVQDCNGDDGADCAILQQLEHAPAAATAAPSPAITAADSPAPRGRSTRP